MCFLFNYFSSNSKFSKRYEAAIDDIDIDSLSLHNKLLLKKRYIPMINSMINESYISNLFYLVLQSTTTIGSIIVPALLSSNDKNIFYNSTNEELLLDNSNNLYRVIWGISLAVTLSNAISQLTNMEKKYVMRHIHSSQMKKEGWNFLQKSSDKYKQGNHDQLINIFWDRIEKLRFKQVVSDLSYDHIDEINDNNCSTTPVNNTQIPANNIPNRVNNTPNVINV
jgi:hypothetical protein